ncbi:MAG TPA: ubiquinol oxidase subunit II [Aliidongia sp.]|uniref:ubiquinol oxidase subunit II n=1 Tax=Aliidongia sp. TaxID=1914230 RepID=UPI002DDCD203|nr:ubiquinol oxidase subunit II [Aliidongia sp.]HEV2677462.1 ubiquinol oxidase subunit II [Aliidongia sp.]
MARPVAVGTVVAIAVASALGGCSGVLDPQGPIASAEKTILFNSLGIMLAIVVPTILATLGVAWWFRAANTRAKYLPDWEYSGRIEMVVWAIPAMTVLLLGGIGWVGSHDLDPPKPISTTLTPVEVEVVSLDWKWLFIYPDLGIASVNRLVVPAGTPIRFELSSDGVMNSFFVPQLGSQIYTMAGMTTHLQLQADKPGTYPGFSAQFSGDGFSDMHFNVDAMTPDKFTAWVNATRGAGATLDPASFAALAKPSQAVPVSTYGSVAQDMFQAIVHPNVPPVAPGQASHAAMHMEK